MITASAVNGTEIFEIVVTNPDNQKAELIANTIADVLPKKIANIVEGSSVRIVDYAIVPAYPVSPSVTKYTAIGLLFGGMLSVGIIVLMELMNEYICPFLPDAVPRLQILRRQRSRWSSTPMRTMKRSRR